MTLNKFLAQSGIASRRKTVDIVKQGIVKVNDVVVTDPGYRVTARDTVTVEDKRIVPVSKKVYIVLNKPKDYITTMSDEGGRKTVMELVADVGVSRLVPIGRLDRHTTGVLLFTNDGDLHYALTHPKFEIEKEYYVEVNKPITQNIVQQLLKGVSLYDGKSYVDRMTIVPGTNRRGAYLSIHSGKYRIIRRMFEALDYQIKKLERISFAGITKSKLKTGQWRHLSSEEVAYLKTLKLAK